MTKRGCEFSFAQEKEPRAILQTILYKQMWQVNRPKAYYPSILVWNRDFPPPLWVFPHDTQCCYFIKNGYGASFGHNTRHTRTIPTSYDVVVVRGWNPVLSKILVHGVPLDHFLRNLVRILFILGTKYPSRSFPLRWMHESALALWKTVSESGFCPFSGMVCGRNLVLSILET